MAEKKRLVVLDGMAYAFRSFYAVPEMSNAAGLPTNAVFGFVSALRRAEKAFRPDFAVVAFDSPGGSFRDAMLKEYKAHREPPPEALLRQFPVMEELAPLMGWHLLKAARYEADDIMATLTAQARKKGLEVVLLSSDKDILQLAGEGVRIYRENPKGASLYGPREVEERFGVEPQRMTDLLGLMGDSSDNIPGVPGVGEKTAVKLLREHGSLEAALRAAPRMKEGKLRDNLLAFADQARLSKKLAELDSKVPLGAAFESLAKAAPGQAALEKFRELGFRSLGADIAAAAAAPVPAPARAAPAVREASPARRARKIAVAEGDLKGGAATALRRAGLDPRRPMGLHVHEAEAPLLALAQDSRALVLRAPGWLELLGSLDELKAPLVFDSKPLQLRRLRAGLGPLSGIFDLGMGAYLLQSSRTVRDLGELAGLLEAEAGPLPPVGQELFEPPAADLAALASATMRLGAALFKRLKADGLEKLYDELEGPLIAVLARMEADGIKLDAAALEELDRECQAEMRELEKKAVQLAGREFNLASPSQLAKVLFEDLKLPHQKKTKTGYSTDSEVLEALLEKHALPGVALEHRVLAKLSGTYLQALPRLVDPADGRLHTSWNQHVAATGRLSSSDPNLQNIPIRTELGRQVRKAFVAGKKGDLILSADYSQIELRILAHYCEDEVLLKAFKQGLDIHRETAASIFSLAPEKVSSEQRSRAKVINFGVLYGMGPYRISREFGIPFKEARDFIGQYFGRFPRVAAFLEECKERCRKQGYVTTLLGRRRYIPEINSVNRMLREAGERTATNLPIQGSAADLIKKAMLDVAGMLERKKARTRLLLQVHDELVFELAQEEAAWLPREVQGLMQGAMRLKCPLVVEYGAGSNWHEAKA